MKQRFLISGHLPSFAPVFDFDFGFMVWVSLGPLAVQIVRDVTLKGAQKRAQTIWADAAAGTRA